MGRFIAVGVGGDGYGSLNMGRRCFCIEEVDMIGRVVFGRMRDIVTVCKFAVLRTAFARVASARVSRLFEERVSLHCGVFVIKV